jgi:alpha-tubulin suppressor-like RCC1 family protein
MNKLGLWGLGFSPGSNSSVLPFPHRLARCVDYGFNTGGVGQDCEAVPISLPLHPNEVLNNAAVSSHAVFALTSSGRILAWGCAQQGRLGVDNLTCMGEESPDSSIIEGLGFVLQVASASEHSLALNSEGAVFSWGSSVAGRLGIGTERSSTLPFRAGHIPFTRVPERINSLPRIVLMACADLHCLALSSDGEVYVWGSASMGRLGIGSDMHSLQHAEASQPLRVKRLMGLFITQVACAKANSGALCSTGQIFTWGATCYGLTSSPANSSSQDEPALLLCTPNGHRFAGFAMGKFHALAMSVIDILSLCPSLPLFVSLSLSPMPVLCSVLPGPFVLPSPNSWMAQTTGRVFSWGWAGASSIKAH